MTIEISNVLSIFSTFSKNCFVSY